MELLKNNKGITLIILVVTIIVLLILAGISISAITGGDSSMDKAKKAKDETAIKAEMEELQEIINQSAAKGIRHGNYSGSADSQTIRNALKKNKLIEENPDDVIIDGKNGWKVTGVKTGQKYKIRYDGEVTRIEELAPTKIYGKIADNILYLRATEQTGYTEGIKWNDSTITKVIIEEPIAPSTCREMFKDCTNLETIENIENLHTENVENFSYMFSNCRKLKNNNFNSFEMERATTIERIFYFCSSLNSIDLTDWNVKNIKNMYGAFQYCTALTNINLKTWRTKELTKLGAMFYYCSHLQNIDLSSFSVETVTDFNNMFARCSDLQTINIENWNTNSIRVTQNMFFGCGNLTTIYVSEDFYTDNITSSANMFFDCNKIVGGNGTTYNSDYIDKAYARIDGGPSNPGYFTLKQ